MSEKELAQLYTEDKYFVSEQIFNVLGLNVIVTDDVIAEALQSLPERKRDIILLSYFLELSDREIGDKLNMLRSTVQYQRTSTLQQLKNFMKGDAYELSASYYPYTEEDYKHMDEEDVVIARQRIKLKVSLYDDLIIDVADIFERVK